MTTPDTEAARVAEIASGMTRSERNVFEALGEPAFRGFVAIHDLEPLFRAGLIAVDDTQLGLAVRAHLLTKDQQNGR